MKQIIIFLICVLPLIMSAQTDPTPDKGSGWWYFSGKPTYVVPNVARQSQLAIDKTTKYLYYYDDNTLTWDRLVVFDFGSGAPSGWTTGEPRTYIDTDDGQIYRWNGSAWVTVGGGAATLSGDYDSDQDAANNGVAIGEEYTLTNQNVYGRDGQSRRRRKS